MTFYQANYVTDDKDWQGQTVYLEAEDTFHAFTRLFAERPEARSAHSVGVSTVEGKLLRNE